MRVIPIEVTDDTISHGEAYQWDEVVRIDFVAVNEIFTEETSVHAVKGRLSQYLQPEYVSSREIYVDLPGWLFESAAENAMVYAYDHGSTVAAASIRITPRGGLPLQDETIDGLVAYRINLNMTPTGLAPLTISVSRFDKDSRVIRARMINGDAVYEVPDSASAMLLMTKADGFGIEIPCTVSNGFVYATLTEQACAAEGPAKAEIRITESGRVLGSANFVILVEPAALDEGTVISDSDIPAIEQAISAAGRAATYADRAQATYDNFAEVVADQVEQMQIHEGQTVIDGTLTVSGAAADAKAAGDRIRTLEAAVDTKAPIIINSASGALATISDGADDMPMTSVAVNIAPLQSGSGDPSPDNVRPISGWTAANVTRTGKNLANPIEGNIYSEQQCTRQLINNGIVITSTANYGRVGFSIPVKSGETYTVSFKAKCTDEIIRIGLSNNAIWGNTYGTIVAPSQITNVLTSYSKTITANTDIVYLECYVGSSGRILTIEDIQLELGSTATDYEPYTANTYSITFPTEAGTVYGGTLDVVKGTLTVDRAMVDLGTLDWRWDSTYEFWRTDQLNSIIKKSSGSSVVTGSICEEYKAFGYNELQVDKTIIGFAVATTGRVAVRNGSTTNMPTNDMCYELATPTTYTLTPTEIKTLLGVNNVWADAGTVDVQYPADTKLYIDGKTAELQALVLENA